MDSEDIPLNLSRELLQDSAQIRKLRTVITNKFLRFLQDKAKKDRKSFLEFYKDYGLFLKEGILTGTEQYEKEEIAKLLRFERYRQEICKYLKCKLEKFSYEHFLAVLKQRQEKL